MTLTQLRTFLAVADTGSVRAAAERLVVTQSAVSASMAALQGSLGVRLVMRQGRGLRLTRAGDSYARYARRALGLLETGRVAAVGENDPEAGQLRLAAVTTAGEQLVPGLLAGFRARYPNAGVLLEVVNRARVDGLMSQHAVDLVIGGRPPETNDVTTLAVRDNELVLIAPVQEAPANGAATIPWMGRQTWLLREPGSGTRAATQGFLERRELAPRSLTVGSNVAIRECVVAGLGITLISRDAVERELEEGAVTTLDAPGVPLCRDWHLIAHAEELPPTAALFVRHLLETGDFVMPTSAHPGRTRARASGYHEAAERG